MSSGSKNCGFTGLRQPTAVTVICTMVVEVGMVALVMRPRAPTDHPSV